MQMLKIVGLLLLAALISCRTTVNKSDKVEEKFTAPSGKAKKVAEESCPSLSAFTPLPLVEFRELRVLDLTLKQDGNKGTTVRVQADSGAIADIFYYQACSASASGNDRCVSGSMVAAEDTSPYFPQGSYEIYARACVFAERVKNKEGYAAIELPEGKTIYCGAKSASKEGFNQTKPDEVAIKRYKLEQKAKKISWELYEQVAALSAASGASDSSAAFSEKSLKTLKSMGPGLFNEATNNLLLAYYTAAKEQGISDKAQFNTGCLSRKQLSLVGASLAKNDQSTSEPTASATSAIPSKSISDSQIAVFSLIGVGAVFTATGLTGEIVVDRIRADHPWKDLLGSVTFQEYVKADDYRVRELEELSAAEKVQIDAWQKEINKISQYDGILALYGETLEYLESKNFDEVLTEMEKVNTADAFKKFNAAHNDAFTDLEEVEGLYKALRNAKNDNLLVFSKEGIYQHGASMATDHKLKDVATTRATYTTYVERMKQGILVIEDNKITDTLTHSGKMAASLVLGLGVISALAASATAGALAVESQLGLVSQDKGLSSKILELIAVLKELQVTR
jgi:hypothetical protein